MIRRLLQAVLVLAATAAAAVIVMYLLGTALPREHTVSAAITINASQGKVWSLLEDVDAQPTWRTGLKAVETLPDDLDGHRCWVEVQRRMRMPLCEEIAASPSTRVVAIVDPMQRYGGTWTYNLTALTAETTDLSITEHGMTGPPVWRFLNHYVLHEDSGIKRFEADLQRAAQRR